ncbi:hypothetical protein ANN_05164 [Periplaneta americana]|uniref:Uncharacterized protein n=1 Tax=Periplaneta americana TaxID=6978 RepID=A0ABQ8TCG1_PERAM|nr:hypothetical protein ANN_05164 [Periplaneta americana]
MTSPLFRYYRRASRSPGRVTTGSSAGVNDRIRSGFVSPRTSQFACVSSEKPRQAYTLVFLRSVSPDLCDAGFSPRTSHVSVQKNQGFRPRYHGAGLYRPLIPKNKLRVVDLEESIVVFCVDVMMRTAISWESFASSCKESDAPEDIDDCFTEDIMNIQPGGERIAVFTDYIFDNYISNVALCPPVIRTAYSISTRQIAQQTTADLFMSHNCWVFLRPQYSYSEQYKTSSDDYKQSTQYVTMYLEPEADTQSHTFRCKVFKRPRPCNLCHQPIHHQGSCCRGTRICDLPDVCVFGGHFFNRVSRNVKREMINNVKDIVMTLGTECRRSRNTDDD